MKHLYTHDIIIIGAGSGGLTCALFMQRAGFSVLLVDRTAENFGGDCLNYGCVPSKALLAAAKHHTGARPADIQSVMHEVKHKQAHVREHENPEYLASLGISIALGAAVFTSKKTIAVAGQSYTAKKIVIATGSRPRPLEIKTPASLPVYTNETIFDIPTLPKHFVFIGGGPIAIELGQAFARLGSGVTIIQSGERILAKESPEVSDILTTSLKDEGVTVLTNTSVESIDTDGVVVRTGSAKPATLKVDALFTAIGRIPNLETLQLEKAGIETDEHGVAVLDSQLRTTNKAVYVIGDAAGKEMFTHAAELQAQIVLNNFFSPFKKSYSADKLGWVTFTDPEIATFGLNELQLKERGVAFKQITVDLNEDDRAITDGATNGFLKLFVSKKGHVLGGTMVGNRSGEITSEILLMMHQNISLRKVLSKPYPYPIGSRVIQVAAREYAGTYLYSSLAKRFYRSVYR